jgi:hypothetical protein
MTHWVIQVKQLYLTKCEDIAMADEMEVAASVPYVQDDLRVTEVKIAESPKRRRGRRSQAEVEGERAKLRFVIESALDALVAEMHLLLPARRQAISVPHTRGTRQSFSTVFLIKFAQSLSGP